MSEPTLCYNLAMGKKFAEQVSFVQKVVILHPKDNSRFLILNRNPKDSSRPGDLDIPGGSVKMGEQHEEALKREVLEETGIEISDIRPVLVNSTPYEDDYFLFIGYCAKALSEDVELVPDEHEGYLWVGLKEFVEENPKHVLAKQVETVLNWTVTSK